MAQMPQVVAEQPKLTVFLSYSRKDNLSFADQLVKGLETFGGMSVLLDRNSIAGGEVWTARTQHLIESCDTILLALSPEAVKSEICNWEIDLALATKKRVFTVFNHDMPDASVPERVRTIHRIFFFENPAVPGSGFATGLAELVEMLRTDVAWVRKHSEVAAAAKRWDDNGRRADDLYKGSQLEEALAWRNARPTSNAPELTDLQVAFLNESDAQQRILNDVNNRRIRNTVFGLFGGFVVVMLLGLIAFIQAKSNAHILGILFAELSQQSFDKSDYSGAMRWALAGVDTGGGELFGPDSGLAEVRLGEANYLNPLLAQKSEISASHVTALPDGGVAAISDDGEVNIFDGRTLTKRGYFRFDNPGPEQSLEVHDVQISPDGSRFLTASGHERHAVRVFDLKTGALRLALDIPGDMVPCARFSNDGRRILTTHLGGAAKLWDASTGALIRSFDKHYDGAPPSEGNRLNCAALSPDGALAATAGDDGFVRIWRTATGALDQSVPVGTSANDVAFSLNGELLAVGTNGGAVVVWNLAVRSSAGRFNHNVPVLAVSFSGDERTLFTLAGDGVARQWSMPELLAQDQSADSIRYQLSPPGAARMIYRGHHPLLSVAFQADGKRAFGLDNTGRLYSWDTATWTPKRAIAIAADAISADGLSLAVAGKTHIEIKNAQTGRDVVRLEHGHKRSVARTVFSPNANLILTASLDNTAKLFDVVAGKSIASTLDLGDAAEGIGFSGDGQRFFATSRKKAVVARASNAEVLCQIAPRGRMAAVALSPDGAQAAVAVIAQEGLDAGVDLWDVEGCARLRRLIGVGVDSKRKPLPDQIAAMVARYDDIDALQYSADGSILLVGYRNMGAEVYDTQRGQPSGRIGDAQRARAAGNMSPDGRNIVTFSGNVLEVWDSEVRGRRVSLILDDQIRIAQFIAAGLGLAAVSDDGRTSFYDMSKLLGQTREARIAAACQRLAALGESAFSATEHARPILQSQSTSENAPCRRKGLLNSEYWMDGFSNAGWKQ